jgi:hypothetical protein
MSYLGLAIAGIGLSGHRGAEMNEMDCSLEVGQNDFEEELWQSR